MSKTTYDFILCTPCNTNKFLLPVISIESSKICQIRGILCTICLDKNNVVDNLKVFLLHPTITNLKHMACRITKKENLYCLSLRRSSSLFYNHNNTIQKHEITKKWFKDNNYVNFSSFETVHEIISYNSSVRLSIARFSFQTVSYSILKHSEKLMLHQKSLRA